MDDILWPEEDPVQITKEMFDQFLLWCADLGANDIYAEAGEKLGIKKSGIVYTVSRRPIRYDELMMILDGVFQPGTDSLLRGGEDLDFSYSVLKDDDTQVSYRVNVTPTSPPMSEDTGCEVTMRVINDLPPTVEEVSLPHEIVELCNLSQGLILMVGATGSGKTTSIAALLRRIIETQRKHVLTYEDPIEYNLKAIPNPLSRVAPCEVYRHIKNWARAVRNSLRRSPDVMLYGELRDGDTIKAGILASETGHLVFATVHGNSVATTFPRMARSLPADEERSITAELIENTQVIIFQTLSRSRDGGRVALRSYLIFTDPIRRKLQTALMKFGDITNVMKELVDEFGLPLMVDVKQKFTDGKIDLDEYISLINKFGDPDDVKIIPNVAKSLYKNGVIDQKELDDSVSICDEIEEEVA